MANPSPSVVTLPRNDPAFPEHLRQIPSPPNVLYCRGNVELLARPAIAVVGTRTMTPYGGQATDAVVHELVRNGFVVVSGLALGVDARAHHGTLEAGGHTIAVLGSGIESITPLSNGLLGKRIIREGGLIVSEYPGHTPAHKGSFPERNRIISGLSLGVAVIEADRDSGSLITARCALEQGRDVFAVPGSIFAPASSGTNFLIAQGARPILTATDIVEDYRVRGILPPPPPAPAVSTFDTPAAQTIFDILRRDGPHHIDALNEKTEFDSATISGTLTLLEIRGVVVTDGHGTWMVKPYS